METFLNIMKMSQKNRSGVSIPKSKSGKTPLDFVPCTLEILKRISKGSGFFRRVLNNSKAYANHFKLRLETKLGIKMPNALSLKMLDSLKKYSQPILVICTIASFSGKLNQKIS